MISRLWSRGQANPSGAPPSDPIKPIFWRLTLEKIEATVFVGHWASRRIFEKNHFILEGTIRKAVQKRGEARDEWLFGITREDYLSVDDSPSPPDPETPILG
jgi:hypothetical protein